MKIHRAQAILLCESEMPHSKAQILDRSGFRAIVFTTQRAISKEAVQWWKQNLRRSLAKLRSLGAKKKLIFTPNMRQSQVNNCGDKLPIWAETFRGCPYLGKIIDSVNTYYRVDAKIFLHD